MRAFTLMFLALVFGAPSAASAQQVLYGFNFIRTGVSIDSRDAFLLPLLRGEPGSGSFGFDIGTNQLTAFNFQPPAPIDFDSSTAYNGDPSPFVLALFNAAGPCDLTCFIGAVNAGTYSYALLRNRFMVTFGDPLNGSILGAGPPSFGREITFFGVLSVTGPIPEPSTWAMMLLGFTGMGVALRRSRRTAAPRQLT